MAKNWRKKTAKIFFFSFFDHKFQFTYPYVSSKDVQVTVEEKPSALKKEHPALQKMKFINCFLFFWAILPSWIQIRIANPYQDTDPGTPLNPDPDPQHVCGFFFLLEEYRYRLSGQILCYGTQTYGIGYRYRSMSFDRLWVQVCCNYRCLHN